MGVDKTKKLLHREHNYLKQNKTKKHPKGNLLNGRKYLNTTYLIYTIYKELIQLFTKKKKKKWAEDVNIYLSKIDIRMANRQKRCLALLIIRELKPQ